MNARPAIGEPCVYVAEDEHGRALYVGATRNLGRRLAEHRANPWWARVANVESYPMPLWEIALDIERVLIRNEDPPFNVQCAPSPPLSFDDEITADMHIVIGGKRVPVTRATAVHTRLWVDIQNKAKARHDVAHGIKTMHAYRLLDVQEERGCSMWQAQQILAAPGESAAS